MSQAFDYNGHVVAPSAPKKVLRTVKKTILIDSGDRDVIKNYTNGEWVAYLPRVYNNVISIRLKAATFSSISNSRVHSYSLGSNIKSSTFSSDSKVLETTSFPGTKYFLVDLKGLNKSDEGALSSNGSAYTDGFFARILDAVSTTSATASAKPLISYNDTSQEEYIARYSPPIEHLDRLQIRTRLHSQQDGSGFLYWTNDGGTVTDTLIRGEADYSLVLEIEMLENGFDEFSSFETRLR